MKVENYELWLAIAVLGKDRFFVLKQNMWATIGRRLGETEAVAKAAAHGKIIDLLNYAGLQPIHKDPITFVRAFTDGVSVKLLYVVTVVSQPLIKSIDRSIIHYSATPEIDKKNLITIAEEIISGNRSRHSLIEEIK